MSLDTLPEWIGTALLGAVIASIGFVGKLLYEAWSEHRKVQATMLAKIIELSAFLTTSRVLFLVQNRWARALSSMLAENHPDEARGERGLEDTFASLHDKFSPEEAELHGRIRRWTVHGLRPVNESILGWLEHDVVFRTTYIKAEDAKKQLLAQKLIELHAHLLLWRCKYDAWIPKQPKHALVYLADEEAHGIGFPGQLDELIQQVMTELKRSAPTLPRVTEPKSEG